MKEEGLEMIGVGGVWEKGEWGLGWECEGWFHVRFCVFFFSVAVFFGFGKKGMDNSSCVGLLCYGRSFEAERSILFYSILF